MGEHSGRTFFFPKVRHNNNNYHLLIFYLASRGVLRRVWCVWGVWEGGKAVVPVLALVVLVEPGLAREG